MSLNSPSIGMVLDPLPTDVNPRLVTFALNAQTQSIDGKPFHYQSSIGNELLRFLPGDLYGVVNMERGERCVFLQNGLQGEIGVLYNDRYEVKYQSQDLNFSSWVIGVYRLLNGCDRIIYFIDGINPDRVINLDKTDQIQSVEELRLQSVVNIPVVDSVQMLNTGGSLPLGSYSFAVELLDEQLNRVAFSEISNQVFTTAPNTNLSLFSAVDGGVNSRGDSVFLQITNIDTNYPYLRIYVLASTEASGPTVYQLPTLIPTQQNISYQVNTLSNGLRSNIDAIRVDQVLYETSQAIEIVDKRLVRGNMINKYIDYSGLQRLTNNVTLEWTTQPINNYTSATSFQSDEIYAFAIQYQLEDFTFTPAFHIPGPTPDATDLQQRTFTSYEVESLGLPTTTENWRVYSTARPDGRFGYYESTESYPQIRDANGQFIFGDLAGQKIRFHRFPTRSQARIDVRLGVRVNLTLPPGTIGYRILFSPRDFTNRTVTTGAIMLGHSVKSDSSPIFDFGYTTTNLYDKNRKVSTLAPEDLAGQAIPADYLQVVNTINYGTAIQSERVYDLADIPRDLKVLTNTYSSITYANDTIRNIPVYESFYVNKLTESNIQNEFIRNYSFVNDINIHDTYYTHTGTGNAKYVLKKVNNQPYLNFTSLNYKLLSPKVFSSSTTVFDGDIFITPFQFYNLIYTERSRGRGDDSDLTFEAYYHNFWLESNIDYSKRVVGLQDNEVYTEGDLRSYTLRKLCDVTTAANVPKFDFLQLDSPSQVLQITGNNRVYEYYFFNPDYQRAFLSKIYTTLPITFNYNNKCGNIFSNRIVWSNPSFSDEAADNFRVFLSENYTTVGTTPITALHYSRNRLLVRSRRALHAMAPNPQQLNTADVNVYLGTGDFLSIPPSEVVSTDYGFAGGVGKLDFCMTDLGWATVDSQAGQIFIIGESFKEITDANSGCQQWFRNNLPVVNGYVQLKYDPRYKLLYIVKNDFVAYRPLTIKDGVYYFENTPVQYGDPNYFENKSFNIAYSLKDQAFISFYSWIPYYMFNDYDGLYSISNNAKNGVWAHNGRYQLFYNAKSDCVVEYATVSPQTVDLDIIQYYAQTFQNETDADFPTFDRFIAYTFQQSTGLQELIPKQNWPTTWMNNQKVITYNNHNYRINAFRDLSTSNTVFSKDWSSLRDSYFIDKVPVNIDYNLSQWLQIPLNDKYFYVRLYFKYHDNTRVVLDTLQSSLNQREF